MINVNICNVGRLENFPSSSLEMLHCSNCLDFLSVTVSEVDAAAPETTAAVDEAASESADAAPSDDFDSLVGASSPAARSTSSSSG